MLLLLISILSIYIYIYIYIFCSYFIYHPPINVMNLFAEVSRNVLLRALSVGVGAIRPESTREELAKVRINAIHKLGTSRSDSQGTNRSGERGGNPTV